MEDTWYKVEPQKENPRNRLIHYRRKKTLNARHARHISRIEPKPRRLCAGGLPLSTSGVCVNGARTKIYERKSTNKSQI